MLDNDTQKPKKTEVFLLPEEEAIFSRRPAPYIILLITVLTLLTLVWKAQVYDPSKDEIRKKQTLQAIKEERLREDKIREMRAEKYIREHGNDPLKIPE